MGQALFRSVKSTHILHFPLVLCTNTIFVNHSGYWISLMWPAFKSLWVSSLMIICLSSLNFLLIWTTSLTFSSIVNLWHRNFGSIPGMSANDQAKVSMYFDITSATLSCNSLHIDVPNLITTLNMLRENWSLYFHFINDNYFLY